MFECLERRGGILELTCGDCLWARHKEIGAPEERARRSSGPFRLTCKPMYVALSTVFLGVCLVRATASSE